MTDRTDLLRRLLQTTAFCLVLSALQYAFMPARPYEIPLVYSLAIGLSTWAIIDLGRLALPQDERTGWPRGPARAVLILVGIVGGYFAGVWLADHWFGWSSWTQPPEHQRASWLFALLASAAATWFFYQRSSAAWLQTQVEASQRQAAEARLTLLQSQLEPHMLFNTLANLRALTVSNPPAAILMLDHLISYLRATLGASRATQHALSVEFARLDDYLQLMAIRMGDRLRYTLDLPTELAGVQVPPLLLQPLVENAIRHGLEPSLAGGSITVSVRRDAATLAISVHDDGQGLHPEGAAGSVPGGFGLQQVRERLANAYGEGGDLSIRGSEGRGCTVTLHLPCRP